MTKIAFRNFTFVTLIAGLAVLSSLPAWTQQASNSFRRVAHEDNLYGAKLLQQYLDLTHPSEPRESSSDDESVRSQGEHSSRTSRATEHPADVELVVDYAAHKIGNDDVYLRCYNGQLAGPTLRVKAGDTLHITLRNKLPIAPSVPHWGNSPHEWNTTNLHFHGLHVAPQGTPDAESDNVLFDLQPTIDRSGSVQKYVVHIPASHVAGTFWYHPHRRGAFAGQVASGMAGALIVERDDDLQNLDAVPEVAAAKEEVMLLQQIPYLTPVGASMGSIERSLDGSASNELAMLGPLAWRNLRRYVTVNGVRIPTITMTPGEVRRLRFIHAGQTEEILLKIVRASEATGTGDESIDFHEIAVDGRPIGEVRQHYRLSLYPGYRSDVLIQPSSETTGEFHLIDARAPAGTGADGSPEPLRLVARIIVEGTPVAMNLPSSESLLPHRPPLIDPVDVTDIQYAFLGIVPVADGVRFLVSQSNLLPSQIPAAQRDFNPSIHRRLPLGTTQRWIVGTRNGGGIPAVHMFHSHVNPFFVEEVRDPGNRIVTFEEIGGPTWRDTLAMKQGYTYSLLTRYEKFTGDFVNRWRILDHDDNGMEELVRIEKPPKVATPLSLMGENVGGTR